LKAARLLLALLLVLAGAALRAQPSETAVKAAFLPRFARYVSWPPPASPGTGAPFQLCVVGRDPFGPLLDQAAATELVDGHNVAVRRIASPDRAAGCQLAFVEGASPQDTSRMLLALRNQAILTITDARAGPQRGMIHFTIVGGRVRFFIDDAEAAGRGLAISSRLLALAAGVRERR
jgi:YfiR/HmsC-like